MTPMNRIAGNIRLFLWQRFLNDFLLIAPILIPFYQFNKMGTLAFYLSQSVYAVTVFLMEVPSGYLADVMGRRNTLIIGAILLPSGLFIYAISSSLPFFLLAELIMALGNSMRSGSDSALLYDSLRQLGREKEYVSIEGKGHQLARMGTGIASVAGGVLAAFSLRLPFWINIVAVLMVLPVALKLVEPERRKARSSRPLQNIASITCRSLKRPDLRPFILYTGLIGSMSIISLWAYFLYYQELSIPLIYFGLLFAVFQFSAALGARHSGRLVGWLGTIRTLALSLLISPILILVGLVSSAAMIPLIMIHPFLWNVAVPILLEQINRKTVSQIRATVLSIANMGVSFGYILIGPVFGQLSDTLPLKLCFTLMGCLFLLLAFPLFLTMRRYWTETERKSDQRS